MPGPDAITAERPASPPLPHSMAAPPAGAPFTAPVPPGGYAWWYIDATSDDGRHAITVIAFIGSVFSPYYAWRGWRDPEDHCTVNVALYGPAPRWAMTERGRNAVRRSAAALMIGGSALRWDNGSLVVTLNETGAPLPRRIAGTLRLTPGVLPAQRFALEPTGKHFWQPIAPRARIEVALRRPAQTWQGAAYFDHNEGSEPVTRGFSSWNWSRAMAPGRTSIFYDTQPLHGAARHIALQISDAGEMQAITPAAEHRLRPGLWGVPRVVRSDAPPVIVRALEDSPFYTRTELRTRLHGADAVTIHESLAAERLRNPLVNLMLPFRMPRFPGRLAAET